MLYGVVMKNFKTLGYIRMCSDVGLNPSIEQVDTTLIKEAFSVLRGYKYGGYFLLIFWPLRFLLLVKCDVT